MPFTQKKSKRREEVGGGACFYIYINLKCHRKFYFMVSNINCYQRVQWGIFLLDSKMAGGTASSTITPIGFVLSIFLRLFHLVAMFFMNIARTDAFFIADEGMEGGGGGGFSVGGRM